MYFRLMGKLNARRNNLLEDNEKGFTLIELLVVVIIIGILAAIAIPVYLGVQNNAKNASVQSDVTNLKTAVVSLQTNTGSLPGAIDWTSATGTGATAMPTSGATPDWQGAGATFGANTAELKYTSSGTTFCIIGTSSTGSHYYATQSSGVSTTQCS